MTFKFGRKTPTKMTKFWRIEMTTRYRDGTDVEKTSTRYAYTPSEKKRAQRRADEINARYHPDTYRPKYRNRLSTIQSRTARVIAVEENTGDAIPVYL